MALEERMIDMRLSRVVLRGNVAQQWIFLTEKEGERGFPIIIGSGEAAEIHRVLTNEEPQRPLTHRLAFAAIEALGGRLTRVDIVDLKDNTFFARMVVARDGQEFALDARPSDALALGLRAGCPIRVAESVLEEVRSDTSGPDPLPGPPPEPPDSGPSEMGPPETDPPGSGKEEETEDDPD